MPGTGDAESPPRAAAGVELTTGSPSLPPAEDTGLLRFLLLAIAGGLFALVMPCTYPMIPITISFFTKQAEKRGGNALSLSLAYGAGIVLIFILIGVVFGSLIIPFASHPVTNLVIGLAFVYFSFVLFGLVDLQPPRALMNVAGSASTKGGYVGVFLMGATLVVTSFTCTAPFVGSLLSFGASEGDLVRVGLGMAAFGLTMAIPFVFLSLVPARIKAMPRSGEWMNTLKVFMGFVELAAALKFLSNVDLVWSWQLLSRELFLLLWGVIFVGAALYLFGVFSRGAKIGPRRLVSAALTFLLALYCFWGMSGKKLDFVMTAIAPNYSGGRLGWNWYSPGGSWTIVKDDYDAALAQAARENKLLLINFTGFT
jgi:thiol:disulfide interchange protein DsbD